jgi:hypothetical protein
MFKIDEVSSSIGVQQHIMFNKEQYSGFSTCLIENFKVWYVAKFQSIAL